jgi:hypothetical protein
MSSQTECVELNLNQPIKFLGATVLSFNSSLGLGNQESTLTVELIEDCENDPPDEFEPNKSPPTREVGEPVLFQAGTFVFAGVLASWDVKRSNSGRVFTARVTDPRQLLNNAVAVISNYVGPPKQGANYFNVYNHFETPLCNNFGLSLNTDQGMPYQRILEGLTQMEPLLCSPTGYTYAIDFSTFPGGSNSQLQTFPAFYRIQGPSITLLSMIQDACDLVGFDFYVYLEFVDEIPVIKVATVNLRQPPSNFNQILDFTNSFVNTANDISYGQELRNEVTKTVLIGEQLHYLTQVNRFYPYFGTDIRGNDRFEVIPYTWDNLGFWILKNINDLNLSLSEPLNNNQPVQIHELDIRCAMASFKAWVIRTMNPNTLGGFNALIRNKYTNVVLNNLDFLNAMGGQAGALNQFQFDIQQATNLARAGADFINQPRPQTNNANKPDFIEDLEAIHSWLANLGNTYYGKEYLCQLNEGICYYLTDYLNNDGQTVYSSVPTNAGGWVDPNIPVLNLSDPLLSNFRTEDGRISCFAVFNTDGNVPDDGDDQGNFGIPDQQGPFAPE